MAKYEPLRGNEQQVRKLLEQYPNASNRKLERISEISRPSVIKDKIRYSKKNLICYNKLGGMYGL